MAGEDYFMICSVYIVSEVPVTLELLLDRRDVEIG